MTARPADDASARPRPRPTVVRAASLPGGRRAGTSLARTEPAAGQMVVATGGALVTGARMGRLLGRSAWRIARQLPGVGVVEQQAHRLRSLATAELGRLLDAPGSGRSPSAPSSRGSGGSGGSAASAEEQQAMRLVGDAAGDPEPLRSAMSELLERSAATAGASSREYLFGTIVSQLVPDEARILAVFADRGTPVPAVDVVAKQVGRPAARPVLANVSAVGAAAGVSVPADTPTYLGRLHAFGLLEFGPEPDGLDDAFRRLADDPAVRAARDRVERGKLGSPRIVRKTIALSPLGREFWAACAPARR